MAEYAATKQTSAPTAAQEWTVTDMDNSLFYGYIAGAVTFGWLLPWIEKKLRKDGE